MEVKRALERRKAGEAEVVPVIVRPADWHSAPFGRLQAVPEGGEAVTGTGWVNEDEAWLDVARRVRERVEEIGRRQDAVRANTTASGEGEESTDAARYLEALERANSYVEIRGMGAQVAEQLPLDRVYTRLRVAAGPAAQEDPGRSSKGRRSSGLAAGLQRGDLGLPDVLRRSRHAVLVGDPGSGKTTFLRFAAQVLARALLRDDASLPARELGLPDGELPLPILVRLSRFAEFLRDHPDGDCPGDAAGHLLRYLDFDLKSRQRGLPAGDLSRRVAAGGCFLLLDGLDEVPGPLRSRVAAIVDDAVAAGGANRHLVTCRTRAFRGLARLGNLPAYPLAPFGDEQIAAFVKGWSRALFQVRAGDEPDGAQFAGVQLSEAEHYEIELLDAIRSHPNVGPMTESPLMLTMLAVVHWSQKKLPERRNELYEVAVEYLLDSRKDLSAFPAPQRREALQALALAMFVDDDGVQRSCGLLEAGSAVTEPLQVDEERARVFLDQESLQSGLLVSRSEGELEFWHLSFQEYLTARELADGGAWWKVLSQKGRLHDDRWAEVVLLLAGCLRRLGLRSARALISEILETGTDRVTKARAVGLVGRILADLKPYGGDGSLGTTFKEHLTATLSIFEPDGEPVEESVRVEVGEALGQAGDPRLADSASNRIAIPGGTFLMGAQKGDSEAEGYDEEADDDETPIRRVTAAPIVLGRYPVTVQEYRTFVEAGREGYLDRRRWDPKGWAWREKERLEAPGSWEDQRRHPNRPVTEVSWFEADAYCRWAGGRLPTEAEWEWAARGVPGRRYPWGHEEPDDRRASFGYRAKHAPPVGVYPLGGTPEGLQDLAGNVWEWCADWFGEYDASETDNPKGPKKGASRVLRGGSFSGGAPSALRAAARDDAHPAYRFDFIGFRVLWSSSGGLGS